jgi:hypothetical protein
MDSVSAMRWLKDYCLMNEETAKKRIGLLMSTAAISLTTIMEWSW